METVIKFKNVYKVYKLYKNEKNRLLGMFFKKIKHTEKKALNNVTFEVKKGESIALLGKNGAGKSTILKIITGVTFPTKGEMQINGRVGALLELTAGFNLELSGRENIYLKGSILGIEDKELKELEKDILDFAELGEYIDQPVRTYSSGMRARLGFAININVKPEILIVDEALSVGDSTFRNKCLKKVNEIMENKNLTFLFVTHSVKTASQFCKRGIVLKNGEIICDDVIDKAIKIYEESC